jgi:AraC family transcriptional activator FtrA
MFRIVNNSAMATHHVTALVAPPATLFGIGCVVEVFDLLRKEVGEDSYEMRLAATNRTRVGLGGTSALLDELGGNEAIQIADTLIIPAYDREPDPDDVEAVRQCFARGARILSICTGSFLLAAAGILDGKRATTHWRYTDEFRRRYPAVRLESDILYADEGQIITAAGSAAGLDMLLHVIRSDHGSEVSNAVARGLNVAPHRDGGQAQFAPRPVPDIADDRINRLVAWMRDNCRQQLTIDELASRVAMSPRNFYRHFRSVTGHTPYDWLLRERIGVAMNLLERGKLTLDRIAEGSGFSSAEALRSHFIRVVGVSPAAYRRMFAGRDDGAEVYPAAPPTIPEVRRVA